MTEKSIPTPPEVIRSAEITALKSAGLGDISLFRKGEMDKTILRARRSALVAIRQQGYSASSIARAIGFSASTIRNTVAVGTLRVKEPAKPVSFEEMKAVRLTIWQAMKRHDVSLKQIRKASRSDMPSASDNARWEISGRLHAFGMSEPTIRATLAVWKIFMSSVDIGEGKALFMDVGGVDLIAARELAARVNMASHRGERDKDGSAQLRELTAPWQAKVGGSSASPLADATIDGWRHHRSKVNAA